MSLYPEVMLASTFAWTTASGGTHDAVLTVSGTPYNIHVTSGNYRVCLAPTTGTVTDFLRAFKAQLDAAGSGLTYTVELLSSGLVKVSATGTFTLVLAAQLSYVLGNHPGVSAAKSATSTTRPKYAAFFAAHQCDDWSPREQLVGRETPNGAQYGVTSGQRHETTEVTFPFIPHSPDTIVATGDDLTPWHPDASHLTSIGSATRAPPWSVRDLCATSLGKVVAYTEDYQTSRSSTAQVHGLCSISATDLAQPRRSLQESGSLAYHRWTVRLLRQSTETRV